MKVKTQFGVKGYSGKVDGMIYYSLPNCDVVIGRRKPDKIELAQQHFDYRLIAENLRMINPSLEFRNDFKVYTALYKELPEAKKSISGWYNLYIAMLWAMQKAEVLDLKTITRALIQDSNLPCKSVKAAIEAGFLLPVINYQHLDNAI